MSATSHSVFPWILWRSWKARNALIFEKVRYAPTAILTQAQEDADIWHSVNGPANTDAGEDQDVTRQLAFALSWQKLPTSLVKCNVGAVWDNTSNDGGASWIIRDHVGKAPFHSRRSYAHLASGLEAELWSFIWAIDSIKNLSFKRVIFEANFSQAREALLAPQRYPHCRELIDQIASLLQAFDTWSFIHTPDPCNRVASAIALSVIKDGRHQSYIARDGPH